MDANGTRFQLVFGQGDWFGPGGDVSPPLTGLDWRASDSTVSLHQNVFVFPVTPGTVPLTIAQRRGAAQDQFGNYYWVGPNQNEIRFLGGQQQGGQQQVAQHFWSAQDLRPSASARLGMFAPVDPKAAPAFTFGGLAVTTDHYLLVGLTSPPGLLLFDLYTGGAPMHYRWPADVPFVPFYIAAAPDGGAWILDNVNLCYWGLDPYFRVRVPSPVPIVQQPEDFQPVGGETVYRSACEEAETVTADLAMPIAAAAPIGIVALPDGSVLILDRPPSLNYSQVFRYQMLEQSGVPIPLNQIDVGQTSPYTLLGQDLAFVPPAQPASGTVLGTLYIADALGAQTFAFNYNSADPTWALEPQPQFFPMRSFGGKALVTSCGQVSYDCDQSWAVLVAQPRANYDTQISWVLPKRDADPNDNPACTAFDGKEPGCVWHRLLMDGTIPGGCRVLVQSRAADSKDVLMSADWNPEPQPYLRFTGSEIPYYTPDIDCCSSTTGTWELLFQTAVGRYLQIQLTFMGNGRSTPRLQAVRAYYPRFSYLTRYMPAVYQDDPVSASFLDRYLANVEGFITVLEGRVIQVQELFDPRTVPAEYLDWLASWLGACFDFTWSTATRRFFLENAPQFFQARGTPDGLIRMIRMSLDGSANASLFDPDNLQNFSVHIIEHFLLRSAPGVTLGDPTDVQNPGMVDSGASWTPAQGAAALDLDFQAFLSSTYSTIAALNQAWGKSYAGFSDPALHFPAVQPTQSAKAADWQTFVSSDLDFTYATVTNADESEYENFLTSRYADVADLNQTYNLTGGSALGSFGDIQADLWNGTLISALPAGGVFLQDWILFVSVVLPTLQNAHQFSVVVPVQLTDGLATQIRRRDLATRITQQEKPAHTNFDVKLYWAAFCAGQSRVGLETVVGPSSRFAALVLDQTELASGYLGFVLPWNVRGRLVAGKDQLRGGVRSGGPAL
jgi:phage tail-like protein